MPSTICSDESFLFNISVSRAKNLGVRSRAFMILLFEKVNFGGKSEDDKSMQIFPARRVDKYTDGQKNTAVKCCHVLHVAHKHELHKLTVTKILSQASGLFYIVDFVYQVCWLIYTYIF